MYTRYLYCADGQPEANVALHVDPPQAHTVNIEPLTATDWESEHR